MGKRATKIASVVFAIVAMAFVLLRWVDSQLFIGQLPATCSRGRSIAEAMAGYYGTKPAVFPNTFSHPVFETSTQYLSWLVESGQLRTSPNFFSAPYVPPEKDLDGFSKTNNAWCVIAGSIDERWKTAPRLFTRNLKVGSVNELKGRILDTLSDEAPYGKRAVIMITNDTKGYVITGHDLNRDWKDYIHIEGLTNPVLRP